MNVTVTVEDLNDHRPAFQNEPYAAEIAESAQFGAEVKRVQCLLHSNADTTRWILHLRRLTEPKQLWFRCAGVGHTGVG